MLAALVAGHAAVTQESMKPETCVQGVMRVLRTMFGGKGRDEIPAPLKVCFCWGEGWCGGVIVGGIASHSDGAVCSVCL